MKSVSQMLTMIVKAIHKLWLRVETADGNSHVIPKITFTVDVSKCGYKVRISTLAVHYIWLAQLSHARLCLD